MARVFISVGSNIDPEKNIKEALRLLNAKIQILKISTVYHTPPELRPEQSWYYNCMVEIDTELRPEELKYAFLRQIEKKLGRRRTEDKFAARTIDLDVALYNGAQSKTGGLHLPDPALFRRPYLAAALLELSPGLELHGPTISLDDAAAKLSEEKITVLEDYTRSLRSEIIHAS